MAVKQKRQAGIIVISTYPDQESILKVGNDLIVNKKLCACINLTKIRSLYSWKNTLEDQEELHRILQNNKIICK